MANGSKAGGRSHFFGSCLPWLYCTSCWLFQAAFPTAPAPTLFFSFFFFQEGGSAELEQEKQTFFLHLIRQLHQPQAPHLPGFHSDYTKHTMTSAGMTSALWAQTIQEELLCVRPLVGGSVPGSRWCNANRWLLQKKKAERGEMQWYIPPPHPQKHTFMLYQDTWSHAPHRDGPSVQIQPHFVKCKPIKKKKQKTKTQEGGELRWSY